MFDVYKIKNIFAVFVILSLFLSSFWSASNELTVSWWQNAGLEDIFKRFDQYKHFSRADKDGRTLLMYALKYTNNPHIGLYFILNKPNRIDMVDKDNRSAIDYARENPNMNEVVSFIMKRNNEFAMEGLKQ